MNENQAKNQAISINSKIPKDVVNTYKSGSKALTTAILTLLPGAELYNTATDNHRSGKVIFELVYPASGQKTLDSILADFRTKKLMVNLFSYMSSSHSLRQRLIDLSNAKSWGQDQGCKK